ncbi:MAG TPA: hypothetical protein PK880_05410 [Candidatus Competibacter sp.]|jgi:hypothetical protein|uniref:Uncharacterized protein n=1 Tax=Candidatus Competibacter denitrificans Run_A_D11 TaxID=1400863 RepID=W6MCV0_9GAMM|nr:hypothetical protein [Candidatus Competibacter denitrificans]CDI04360.1 hypothetical protein BN873_950043 [Candidatus Competibacter denitrificans Run_A_D11]HRC71955.1 hypothetical protein [Candidatus Competibacter sp.]
MSTVTLKTTPTVTLTAPARALLETLLHALAALTDSPAPPLSTLGSELAKRGQRLRWNPKTRRVVITAR